MKILIVDDEKLTRDGLVSSINWEQLLIKEVLVAENGIQGLQLAKKHKPQIILSDIRMPRMDGIQMAEQLQEILPNSSIIFMSGYSDKEYLKAAIKLKAISYVEKPLDPLEIEAALQTAISENQQNIFTQTSVATHTLATATQLALQLTYPPTNLEEQLADYFKMLKINKFDQLYFTTMIIKCDEMFSSLDNTHRNDLLSSISSCIEKSKLKELHVIKHESHIIYHLMDSKKTSMQTLCKITKYIKNLLSTQLNFFVIIGKTTHGYTNAYQSYSSAVILTQRTFFLPYQSIIVDTPQQEKISANFDEPTKAFQVALDSLILENIEAELEHLLHTLETGYHLLPTQVKDIYYKLFMMIQSKYKKHQLNLHTIGSDSDSIMDYVEPCTTLLQLHTKLEEKVHCLFEDLSNHQPENPVVFSIKKFINKYYMNELLSVKDLGEHVNLSASYVCTLFKSETGQTINQYITDFRMQKAKELLEDPIYKITDISSKVGYSDGNYFGKSFKKSVGISPSEYREKMLL